MKYSSNLLAVIVGLLGLALFVNVHSEPPVSKDQTIVTSASAELIDAAIRYLDAAIKRDVDYLAANSSNESGSYSTFSSGHNGYYDLQGLLDHLRPLAPADFSKWEPFDGFVAGDFAWFAGMGFALMPNGDKHPVRVTVLMRHVDGVWKVVHSHLSGPL